MASTKRYKCPYCNDRYIRADLIKHVDKKHSDVIPEGYTAARVVYNSINHCECGKCRVCGKPTEWNEQTGRYNVLCGDPKCKEAMRKQYQDNMMKVYGTDNILNDEDQQKKMLANRSISGKYRFQDGGELTYTGSYEKKCLEFMDVVMNIPSTDIIAPGPTLQYEYNGEKHFYITDFYYIPYNLIIEVKDGEDNKNNKDSASMRTSREKTIQKEKIITDRGEFNYIRLTNNDFAQLLSVFMDIKQKLLEGDDSKTYHINENAIIQQYFKEDGRDENNNYILDTFSRIRLSGEVAYRYHFRYPFLTSYLSSSTSIGYIWTDNKDCIVAAIDTEVKPYGQRSIRLCWVEKGYESLKSQMLKFAHDILWVNEAGDALYGIKDLETPEDVFNFIRKNVKYNHEDKVHTPEEVLKNGWGDCHDQAYLAEHLLKQRCKVKTERWFFIELPEDENDNVGGTTHTACFYKDKKDNKWHWFETAWGGQEKIHRGCSSVDGCITMIKQYWDLKSGYKLYWHKTTVKPPCDFGEYVQKSFPDDGD